MPFKNYRSKYRKWKKRARGKSYRGRRSFAQKVKKVLMKNTETKMCQAGFENIQLYHDRGALIGPSTYQACVDFNPWRLITQGSLSRQRIGDKIYPRMMVCRLWLANKDSRPNLIYRVIVAKIPKIVDGTIMNGNNLDLFQASHHGSNGNTACGFIDSERGIRAYYDRIISIEGRPGQRITALDTFSAAETHKFVKFVIKRKRARAITYDINGVVNNNPIGIWVIPYDSWGTLQTDNVASCALTYRLYYKDV